MEKMLTIGEIDNLRREDFTEEEIKKIESLDITVDNFISSLKDDAILSGMEDDEEFITISDYIAHIEEMNYQNRNEENEEHQETSMVLQNNESSIVGFGSMANNNIVRPQIITNITDKKMMFNLGKKVDKMLNDCEGQEITIDKILIKKYVKPLDNPIIDPQTGEIIAETKTSMSIVIVDKNGISYATGSKTFGYQLMNCIFDFGDEIEGLKIRIIKTMRNGNKNKSLDFELV